MSHTIWGFLIIAIGLPLFNVPAYGQAFQSLLLKTDNQVSGETLELRLDNFVSSPSNVISSDQDLLFSAHSIRGGDWGTAQYKWDLGGRYSRYESFQLWVRESYLSGQVSFFDSLAELSLGRKYFSKLDIDSVWNLGAMESQFRGDPFDPVHQGLTGIFFDVFPSDQLKFKFFISAVSFPDLGTSFDVKNGQVSSSSPWFVSAPTEVSLNGNEIPLTYDLDISNQYEKLFRLSAMMGMEWNDDDLFINVNAGVLPSRRWTLNVRPKGQVVGGTTQVLASVNPEMLNRVVGSVSFKKKLGADYTLSGEYFAENYIEDITDKAIDDDMQSNTRQSSFAHLGLSKENMRWGKVLLKTDFAYLRRLSTSFLQVINDFEYSDYNFDNAASVQVTAAYMPWNLQFQFKAFYDFSYDSILVSPRLQVQTQKDLMLYTRFDLVGSESDESSFLGNQRANDRFIFGITYAM